MNLRDVKREIASAMLDRGSCFVHLDPRRAGVVVPAHFLDRATLTLQFAYGMARPIFGLECDHEGIRGALTFGPDYFTCDIPWHAVHALSDDAGEGVHFAPDPDVPAASPAKPMLHAAAGGGESTVMSDARARIRRRAFRVIEGGANTAPAVDPKGAA